MKKLVKVSETPQDIETIIHSFGHYALGDIIHTKCKPIAAFILSMCFIDSLSCFVYAMGRDRNKRPEDFIRDYMNEYIELDLYDYFRHSLCHNYSSQGKFDIDNRGNQDVLFNRKGNVVFINTDVFIGFLQVA